MRTGLKRDETRFRAFRLFRVLRGPMVFAACKILTSPPAPQVIEMIRQSHLLYGEDTGCHSESYMIVKSRKILSRIYGLIAASVSKSTFLPKDADSSRSSFTTESRLFRLPNLTRKSRSLSSVSWLYFTRKIRLIGISRGSVRIWGCEQTLKVSLGVTLRTYRYFSLFAV